MATINGSPSSFDLEPLGPTSATIVFAIPAGTYTSGTWSANRTAGGDVVAQTSISDPATQSQLTGAAGPGVITVAVNAAQLTDINNANGGNLSTRWYGIASQSIDDTLQLILVGTSCTFSILPVSAHFDASSHTGQTVAVTTQGGCVWTATANDSWLHVTAGSPTTGSGNLTYSVDANTGSARSGSITIAGIVFSVMQDGAAPPVCTYNLSPSSAGYTSNAATGSFSVQTQTSCSWTAVSNDAFITVTSGASGTGPGVVGYSITANGTGSTRTGTITAGGKTFTITQTPVPPVCSYALTPAGASYPVQGGNGGIAVATQTGCAWAASSGCAWVHVTGQSGSPGNGSIQYSVDSNYPAPSTLPAGCIAYWKLEETGTAVRADSTANALDLTPAASLSNGPGIIGNGCVCTNGINGLSRSGILNTPNAGFSLSVWVNFNSLSSDTLVGKNGARACMLQVSSGTVKANFYDGATQQLLSSGAAPSLGALHHYVLTYDGVTVTLYKDGSSVNSAALSLNLAQTQPFLLGSQTDGTVDESAVWNRALSAAEVTELYAAGVGDQYPFTTTSPTRTCNITAGGQTFVVSQAGSAQVCTYALSATQGQFDRSGGSRQIFVVSQNGCAWNAVANDPWLHIVSGSGGVYPTNTVTYSVDANGGAYRVGHLTIAGISVEIDQSGNTPAGGGNEQSFIFIDRIAMHERKILPPRYFDFQIDGLGFSMGYQLNTLPLDPTWILVTFGIFNFSGTPSGESCELGIIAGANNLAQQETLVASLPSPLQLPPPIMIMTCQGQRLVAWRRGRDLALLLNSISSFAPTPSRIKFQLSFFFDTPEGV